MGKMREILATPKKIALMNDNTIPQSVTIKLAIVSGIKENLPWNDEQESKFTPWQPNPACDALRKQFLEMFRSEADHHAKSIGYDVLDPRLNQSFYRKSDAFNWSMKFLNDQLLVWILSDPEIESVEIIQIMRIIIAVQTNHVLMENEPNGQMKPAESKIIRGENEEVYHSGQIILPYLKGKHVEEALCETLQQIEKEFYDLEIEEAVTKAVVYFNLMMLIHSQKDFNKRILRYLFNYLINKSLKHKNSRRLTFGKGAFGDHDREFTHIFLNARIQTQMELFEELFPEIKELKSHIKKEIIDMIMPIIMSHTFQSEVPFSGMMSGFDGSADIKENIYDEPLGLKIEQEALVKWLEGITNPEPEDFFENTKKEPKESLKKRMETLKTMLKKPEISEKMNVVLFLKKIKQHTGIEESTTYFNLLKTVCKKIQSDLMQNFIPKIRVYKQNGGTKFDRFHFQKWCQENKLQMNIDSFMEFILYGLNKFEAPTRFSEKIATILKKHGHSVPQQWIV